MAIMGQERPVRETPIPPLGEGWVFRFGKVLNIAGYGVIAKSKDLPPWVADTWGWGIGKLTDQDGLEVINGGKRPVALVRPYKGAVLKLTVEREVAIVDHVGRRSMRLDGLLVSEETFKRLADGMVNNLPEAFQDKNFYFKDENFELPPVNIGQCTIDSAAELEKIVSLQGYFAKHPGTLARLFTYINGGRATGDGVIVKGLPEDKDSRWKMACLDEILLLTPFDFRAQVTRGAEVSGNLLPNLLVPGHPSRYDYTQDIYIESGRSRRDHPEFHVNKGVFNPTLAYGEEEIVKVPRRVLVNVDVEVKAGGIKGIIDTVTGHKRTRPESRYEERIVPESRTKIIHTPIPEPKMWALQTEKLFLTSTPQEYQSLVRGPSAEFYRRIGEVKL